MLTYLHSVWHGIVLENNTTHSCLLQRIIIPDHNIQDRIFTNLPLKLRFEWEKRRQADFDFLRCN